MAETPRKEREVLGIRLLRRGRSIREFDLEGVFTVGGLRTNSTVIHGEDPEASATHFKEGPEGKAVLLFDENSSGQVVTRDGETSLTILRSSGVLQREDSRWAFTIEKGVTGTIETNGLTFEFGYRPAGVSKPVTIPDTGPGFAEQAAIFGGDEDTVRFRKTFAMSMLVGIGFFVWTQVANPVEREFRIEDIIERVTELEIPDVVVEGVGEAVTDTGTGTGGGGGGGGGSGGGGDGTAMPSTGVMSIITKAGLGGGGIADILGGGGGAGDLDTIASGIGGLRGAGSGDGLGGGLGFGDGTGTGLGGTGEGMGALAGGGGGLGDGSGTKLHKKSVTVTASGPNSIAGEGAADANRSAARINSVIRQHLAGIQNAYNSELKKNPNLGGGKIVVRFTISPDGSVTSASIVSSSMGAPGLESSIISRIYGWRFPSGASGEVTVVYPFVFIATG
ncbi:MAG: TonB family protein [Candidatus Coatesbacteria bacterium]|nr:MAG: TonB family protein [Candidatus Coatesbacteria bacterium]